MGLTEELRWAAAKLMGVGKFAVDSAVTESLRGGLEVYTAVKGKLKGRIPLSLSNESKKKNCVVGEEMQAKLEKLQQQHINGIGHQSKISALRKQQEESPNQHCDEPVKVSAPEIMNHRKIFIRSRL